MLLVLVVSVLCAICVACLQLLPRFSQPRIAVRNNGTQTLTDTRITLTSPIDGKKQVIDLPSLSPSETVERIIEISGDPKLKLEYKHDGNDLKHTNEYIDLWPSDTWLIEIGGDGHCTEGYWTDRPVENSAG
jgi:hypothetical protein